ncbi:MAG: MmcQ/YjbR family DNA-binding protein [Gemmatimonadota bacterium]
MPPVLDKLRKICLSFPEAHEKIAWGEPTFRVKDKLFAMYANAGNHHGDGRHAVWCKATHVDQELLIKAEPNRYFKPPYVGPSGWVGIYLDSNVDWAAVADQLRDAYRLIAPKKLGQDAAPAKTEAKAAKRPAKTKGRAPRRQK